MIPGGAQQVKFIMSQKPCSFKFCSCYGTHLLTQIDFNGYVITHYDERDEIIYLLQTSTVKLFKLFYV